MADGRPKIITFLRLTQEGHDVTGSLLLVIPDGEGGTIEETIHLTGTLTTRTNYVHLKSDYHIFGPTDFGAYREERQVKLMFPHESEIGTGPMTKASEEEFNALLSTWKEEVARRGAGAELGVATLLLHSGYSKQHNINDENGIPLEMGVLVTQVGSGSPAEKAGVKAQDVILSINDSVPTIDNKFSDILGNFYPGDTVTLNILRAGKRIELMVTLGILKPMRR